MKQHRSISQRLQRCKNPETRLEIINDWATEWLMESNAILDVLKSGEKRRDWDLISQGIARVISLNGKKLSALPKVFEALLNLYNEEES